MPQATRLLWLLLAVLTLPGAAGQSYWLYSGQAGAQTQIDVDHTSTWTIQVTSGTLLFAGARLTMKRGPTSSTSVTLSVYQGNSAAGTLLGTATLANNAFTGQFAEKEFALSSLLTLNTGTYFVALTSPAPDVQSQAYFIKGIADSLVSLDGTPGSQPSNVVTSPSLVPTMTLEKTAPATVTTNSNLAYTFNLGNEGTGAILGGTSVILADQLPAGTTYVSAAPGTNVTSVSCVQATPLLNCTVVLSANGIPAGTVAADGPSFTVTVTTSSSTGSITNYASVAEDGVSAPPAPGAACTSPNCASATSIVALPTQSPTVAPSRTPTQSPTRSPTNVPTVPPTRTPTQSPTNAPTRSPTVAPTRAPTRSPTTAPTNAPTTAQPTTSPTRSPTNAPTTQPTTSPTRLPTVAPTRAPTRSPTNAPTNAPTIEPTRSPTNAPTTAQPTTSPTRSPTNAPTTQPTTSPTRLPTQSPTTQPTPSSLPPTQSPTVAPTVQPTSLPTQLPTQRPTIIPSGPPTHSPTMYPSTAPTQLPTKMPTQSPTAAFVVDTDPASFVGHQNGSTLNGNYFNFPPSGDVVYFYKYAPCSTYNVSTSTTPNGTITGSQGSGTLPGVAVSGLAPDTLYCYCACAIASSEPNMVTCGGVQTFSWPNPEPIILSPADVTPYNATFNGNYTDLNPGSNISSYYQYGNCSGFPAGASITPVQTLYAASASGTLPAFTVGDLQPSSTYCVAVCIQDDTAGSGYFCSALSTFDTAPQHTVYTSPATGVGIGSTATLNGGYANYVPGHDLVGYYVYNHCENFATNKTATANQTIISTGNGTIPPTMISDLNPGHLYCYQACIVDLDADPARGDPIGPVCGNTVQFYWPSPEVRADNATDITPYNATLNGYLLDPLPIGHNLSYNFVYGVCGTNPLQWPRTPNEVLTEINGSQPLQSARVGNLQPQTEYCYTACVTDLTAGTDEFCGNVVRFATPPPPVVQTNPPYNVGYNNGSTLSGSYSSFEPGHDLVGYYLYAPCATYNTAQMSTANQSIPNNPTGNGTLAPVAVTGLMAETLYCTQACVVDLDADPANGGPTGPVCGAVETFIWPTPEPVMDPPSGVTLYNATFSGSYSDFNPGSNLSYYYQYEPCDTAFSAQSAKTPVGTISNAPGSGALPSATVGGLQPSISYCARVCIQDDTAGSGYICSATPQTFVTPPLPVVVTLPPTNVGVGNTSTLQGNYSLFVPGETLEYYHRLAPCDTFSTSAQIVGNGSIPNNPGGGPLPPAVVGPLQGGVVYCTQACALGPSSNLGIPVSGQVLNFSFPPYAMTNNATDVAPSSAVFNGGYGDLPTGHDLSFYYSWGLCSSYPSNSTSTNVSSLINPGTSGPLPPLAVTNLIQNEGYCYQACVQDDTTSSGYFCGETVQFSTPPYPPSPFYQPVIDGLVCTPEYILVVGQRRRLEQAPAPAPVPAPAPAPAPVRDTFNPYAPFGGPSKSGSVRMMIANPTPQACYLACRDYYQPDEVFLFNFYVENGQQVCSCCRVCEGTRYVPGAVVYASCRPLKAVPVRKHQIRTASNDTLLGTKRVVFGVQNPGEGTVDNVGIQVQLPEGMKLIGARSIWLPKYMPVPRSRRKVRGVYNATTRTVMWWPLPFNSWQSYVFQMKVHSHKAGKNVLAITSFQQSQTLNVNETALPYCQNPVGKIKIKSRIKDNKNGTQALH